MKTHVSDARDFVWSVADCDDQGEAFLSFRTELAATVVSQSFLADPACSPSDADDAAENEVMCKAGAATSYLYALRGAARRWEALGNFGLGP